MHLWSDYVTLDKSRVEKVGSGNETSHCIFRVSTGLLKECEDAYEPQIVSIGPYYSGKDHLRGMETFKVEALSRVLVRILLNQGKIEQKESFNEEEKDGFNEEMRGLFKQMIGKLGERENDIRQCYDEGTDLHGLDWKALYDGCFILEFFRSLFNESVGDYENLERFFPKFGSKCNPVVRSQIMKDLIKIANQIPLFVLEEILSMETRDPLKDAKSRLQVLLKAVFHKFYYRPFDCAASWESLGPNHILDVYYYFCLGAEEPQEEKKKAEEPQEEKQKADLWIFLGSSKEDLKEHRYEKKVPSAVQLKNGGVKVQAKGKKVQDICFDGKTLHMPPIQLESDSEIFIRNLIALEIFSPYGSLRRMTAFIQFMNELCQTEKGAAIMRENGVIVGNLWQDSEIIRLFSSCTPSHSLPSCYPIEVTRKNLMEYYSRKSKIAVKKAWNEFRETYFSKPWFLIGGIGATIILILTAVQVFCLFHSCRAH